MSKKSYFIKEIKKKKIRKKLLKDNIHKNNIKNVFFLRSRKKKKYSQRTRKRCFFSGRPRGYINLFGFSRIIVRELISNLYIPGSIKASW
ncbi:SSU ribosomal protein S14p (S29e) [Candidatus Vidania fulgoroideae]|nr:SSU ribosomal protein S14p (S29e) [Candidatus Vidania fulgoroideae]